MDPFKKVEDRIDDSTTCAIMGRCVSGRSGCFLLIGVFFLFLLLLNDYRLTSNESFATNSEDLSYGIIIDAGSTGSRLFLYCWRSHSDRELISIEPVMENAAKAVVKKVTPGLSTFATNPDGTSEYIRPLLDYASKYIPVDKHSFTPVFIYATAGMRLLPLEKQNAIMSSLHSNLPKVTTLQVLPEHIRVIDGKWEGIYSWIAVNYILGRFRIADEAASTISTFDNRPKTVGMIDMGGASAQIAFELPTDSTFTSDNVESVNLGCRDDDKRFLYQVFVTTFLGFGVNEASKKYEMFLQKKLNEKRNETNLDIPYVRDGCLPSNMMKLVNTDAGEQYLRKGTGDWDACVGSLSKLICEATELPPCPIGKKCFFGGVIAPPISLSEVELYGFSEYWYSVDDVLSLGGAYNHDEMEISSRKYCGQRWKAIQAMAKANGYPKADAERLQTQCFKSAWIHAILHDGFSVSEKKHKFQSALKIQGQEVQWALGAMIYNMRYFPLRDAQAKALSARKSSNFGGSFLWPVIYLSLIVVFIAAAFLIITRWAKSNSYSYGSMRRDPSIWGYMMLNQQDQFSNNYPRTSQYPL